MTQNNDTSKAAEYFRREQEQRDQQQISLFRAGAAGLATAGLARWLFGNRGS